MTLLKESKPLIQISIKEKKIKDYAKQTIESISIPKECDACGFTNYNIGGVLQNQNLTIKLSCMRCGYHIQNINHNTS